MAGSAGLIQNHDSRRTIEWPWKGRGSEEVMDGEKRKLEGVGIFGCKGMNVSPRPINGAISEIRSTDKKCQENKMSIAPIDLTLRTFII